jgi:putative membrane protein
MMWDHGMSWFGWLVMSGWWVLLVVGIVWLVRSVASQPAGQDSARRILDERFAAGDLSVEEYQARRRALG